MKIKDNHFSGDFLLLEGKYSSFKIAAELSFHERELGFNQLSFPVSDIIELNSHFLTVSTSKSLFQERIGMIESA